RDALLPARLQAEADALGPALLLGVAAGEVGAQPKLRGSLRFQAHTGRGGDAGSVGPLASGEGGRSDAAHLLLDLGPQRVQRFRRAAGPRLAGALLGESQPRAVGRREGELVLDA